MNDRMPPAEGDAPIASSRLGNFLRISVVTGALAAAVAACTDAPPVAQPADAGAEAAPTSTVTAEKIDPEMQKQKEFDAFIEKLKQEGHLPTAEDFMPVAGEGAGTQFRFFRQVDEGDAGKRYFWKPKGVWGTSNDPSRYTVAVHTQKAQTRPPSLPVRFLYGWLPSDQKTGETKPVSFDELKVALKTAAPDLTMGVSKVVLAENPKVTYLEIRFDGYINTVPDHTAGRAITLLPLDTKKGEAAILAPAKLTY